MAIHFTKLYYKNFLSTGNAGTTILLDRNPTTLIQGASGAGKSTMIDALCFALFGKPFRNITKPQLVNSVNGKQCEVQVEFSIGSKSYKVVRCIKPNKFDIFCDGKLVTQDAAVKDYQKVLEQQILMMTFKTFTQIVILGSTAYTPFMQLPAAARREVIEDILDIGIFSTMNMLLKQQIQETKDTQTHVDSEIKAKKEKADGLKRLIEVLSTKRDGEVTELKAKIDSVDAEMVQLEEQLSEKSKETEDLAAKTTKLKEMLDANTQIVEKIAVAESARDAHELHVAFFNDNDSCPTCEQGIPHEHKNRMVTNLLSSINDVEEKLENLRDMKTKMTQKINAVRDIADLVNDSKTRIKELTYSINVLIKSKAELVSKLASISTQSNDIDGPREELKEVARVVLSLVDQKKQLAETRLMQENASVLLRDTGIKTAIIKEYLPIINKLLNRYLIELQMDVEFTLDEQFNEVVKSRHRDEFTYGSFSEGEKLRLDLALMMTWRHIAKLKNSASCNLLIIDEVLSGRLDPTNQDIVIEMINSLAHEGSNILIIAHQDGLADKFRSGLRFEKQGNFSVMV